MTVDSAGNLPLLTRLKAETRVQHHRAESALNLLDPQLTGPQYDRILGWLRHRHAQLEPRLSQILRDALPDQDWARLDLEGRAKLPLLDLDLIQLDVTPGAPEPAPDWLQTEAHAWGSSYVLEGATLGGQVVIRHLRRHGIPPHRLHYHSSYGDQVGPRWRTFGDLLTARHAQAAQPAHFATEAIDAARRTFELLTYPTPITEPEAV